MRPGAAASSSPTITAPAREAAKAARVPAVREEGDVGRPGVLERHDPLDAHGPVPLDAAADPLRQLGEAEVHGASYFVAGAAAGAAFFASGFLAGAPALYLALYRRTSSCVMLAEGGATMSPAFCCSKT